MQTLRLPEPSSEVVTEPALTLGAVCSVTGWSERTAWRRLSAGSLFRVDGRGNRVLIAWDSVQLYARLCIDDELLSLLCRADRGDVEAQNEVALHFFEQALPCGAVYWLQQAARSGDADAMHWLGRCHLEGKGLEPDRNLGLMWLARSAAAGHVISDALLHALCGRFVHEPFERPAASSTAELAG